MTPALSADDRQQVWLLIAEIQLQSLIVEFSSCQRTSLCSLLRLWVDLVGTVLLEGILLAPSQSFAMEHSIPVGFIVLPIDHKVGPTVVVFSFTDDGSKPQDSMPGIPHPVTHFHG